MAIRIAFDQEPSNSGPGRYVGAITRALDPQEFEVIYLTGGSPRRSSACAPPTGTRGCGVTGGWHLEECFREMVPRTIRLWAGFARTTVDQASRLRRHRVDLFHVQNCGCEEWPLAGKLAGVKRVVGTFHVNPTVDIKKQRQRIRHRVLEFISSHSLDRAIAVSEATREMWVRRIGLPDARVTALHNGVDPGHFKRRLGRRVAKAALGLPGDAVVIGGVGRLVAVKGYAHLIDAAAELANEFPDMHLVLAGDGPDRAELCRQVERAGLGARVHLQGWTSDVRAIYDALDVFVMPSLSEALPFALLEAMAHELPTVASGVGGIPEIIVNGQTGMLARPSDGTALAAVLRPLLASAELRQRMGAAGRQRVVRHFHESECVRKTIQVYREILAPA